MNPIEAPLKPGDSGANVVNLIQGLLLIIEHGLLKTLNPPSQPTAEELAKLVVTAKQESLQKYFGMATQQIVRFVQIQNNLGESLNGLVDEKTATLINSLFEKVTGPSSVKDFEVFTVAVDATGRPLPNVEVRAFDRDYHRESGLGQATTDEADRYRITIPASLHRKTKEEVDGPELFVRAFDAQGQMLAQSRTVLNAGASTELNLTLSDDLRSVSGTVLSDTGRPLIGLQVRVFDRDLRSEELLVQAKTDAQGRYRVVYTAAKFRRALVKSADGKIVPKRFRNEINAVLARFKELIVQEALQPNPSPAQSGTSLGDLLETALEEPQLREDFVKAYVIHTGPIEDFWKSLEASPSLKDKMEDLQYR